ncbi:hypothetical protein JTB14_031033 [Gonioctena quinquepunctata]|nr:hypothetical protein JTB14_031033 [Gonioctena quinquepunctata]
MFCSLRVSNRLFSIPQAIHTKRARIPVEEVSDNDDNDYDSKEDASEPSDYEEHSDTDDEDTEEARSEIGEDRDNEEELERQNNENVRPGWKRWNCLPQPIVDTNPQSTRNRIIFISVVFY